jgi:hypothetical protein
MTIAVLNIILGALAVTVTVGLLVWSIGQDRKANLRFGRRTAHIRERHA